MRELAFRHSSWQQYENIAKNKKLRKKFHKIIKDMLRSDDPSQRTGKPEPLKYELEGKYSRRLSEKDRLIYSFDENYIYIFMQLADIMADVKRSTAKLVVEKYYPQGSVSQQTESLKVFKFLATLGEGRQFPGWMEYWAKGIDILYKFKQIDRKVPADDVFTMKFLEDIYFGKKK